MGLNKAKLKFSRVENKYLVPRYLFNEVACFFSKVCKYDEHNTKGNPYNVISVYFDSPDLCFYHDKIDGYPDRKKVRIRFYRDLSRNPDEIFLEIKNKTWEKIYKERVLINRKNMEDLLSGSFSSNNKVEDSVFQKFKYLEQCHNLSPKAIVSYERLSFIDKVTDFKVSLDANLQTTFPINIHNLYLSEPVLRNFFILEMKFDDKIPVYAINFLRKYNFSSEAISKYCYSMDKLYNK
jgi:hypothetical protein